MNALVLEGSNFSRPASWDTAGSRLVGVAGSPGIAAAIAHAVFWGLILYGWALGELNVRRVAVFPLLWLAGRLGAH